MSSAARVQGVPDFSYRDSGGMRGMAWWRKRPCVDVPRWLAVRRCLLRRKNGEGLGEVCANYENYACLLQPSKLSPVTDHRSPVAAFYIFSAFPLVAVRDLEHRRW